MSHGPIRLKVISKSDSLDSIRYDRIRNRIHTTDNGTLMFFLLSPDGIGDGKVGILQLKLAVLRGQFRYGHTRLVRVRHG